MPEAGEAVVPPVHGHHHPDGRRLLVQEGQGPHREAAERPHLDVRDQGNDADDVM